MGTGGPGLDAGLVRTVEWYRRHLGHAAVAGRLAHQATVAASATAGWTSGDGSGTGSSGVATHAGRSVGSASATAGCRPVRPV